MNKYEQLISELKDKECKVCNGLGRCSDAEPGDIFYNSWECPECKGSGIKEKNE